MRLSYTVLLPVLVAVLCTAHNAYSQTSHYIEVESIPAVAPWELSTDKSDFSGTGYFNWTETSTITRDKQGILEYTFSLSSAGKYIIDFRGRRDHEGVCEGEAYDQCNDIWTKMDNDSWSKTMVKGSWDTWIWNNRWEPQHGVIKHELQLSAGSHTLSIAGRSKGVKIDCFAIYLDGSSRPDAPTNPNATPTSIIEPDQSQVLAMGSTITLKAEGDNISWAYDANSDNLSEIAIGSGNEIEFTVPTGVENPMELTLICRGDGGAVEQIHDLSASATSSRPLQYHLTHTKSDRVFLIYSLQGRLIGKIEGGTPECREQLKKFSSGAYAIREMKGTMNFISSIQ
ncbi:MAG: hypothetical protein GF401_19005 [Chitinivibrionales bacterium]|nr:hypothetical protein [Chitinivibrionales bacterium]